MHFITSLFTFVLLLTIFTLVRASLDLSDIQALVGFPQGCTEAYSTPINDCDDAHFSSGPLCSCSSACSSALDSMTYTIINACHGTSASPDSLIGLFFNHAATNFLCSAPANGGGGGCGNTASGSGPASSAPSSSSQQSGSSTASSASSSSSSISSSSQRSSSTTTTQASSSTQSKQSKQSKQSSTSTEPSTSSTTSASSLTTSSTLSSTSRATSTATATQPKQTSGGGSPFDISNSAGTRIDLRTQTSALMLVISAAIGIALL